MDAGKDDIRSELMIGLHTFLEEDIGEYVSIVYQRYYLVIVTKSSILNSTNSISLELVFRDKLLLLLNQKLRYVVATWSIEDPGFSEQLISDKIMEIMQLTIKLNS